MGVWKTIETIWLSIFGQKWGKKDKWIQMCIIILLLHLSICPCVLAGGHRKQTDPVAKSYVSLQNWSPTLDMSSNCFSWNQGLKACGTKWRSTKVLTNGGPMVKKEQCLPMLVERGWPHLQPTILNKHWSAKPTALSQLRLNQSHTSLVILSTWFHLRTIHNNCIYCTLCELHTQAL